MLVCNNLKTKIGGTLLQFQNFGYGRERYNRDKTNMERNIFPYSKNFDCYENVLAKAQVKHCKAIFYML